MCNGISLWKSSLQSACQILEIWPEAAKPGIWNLWKDLLMKSITSRQLAKKVKSGPEAAKPGNEGFVKGSPYEKCHFRAACQNLQILAWSRHAWRRKVCKEISLRLEGGVFIRRSFDQAFISLRGGSITRFPGLAAQDQISRFWPPVCKWLWLFWENLNSKLFGSSVRFQGVCNGLETFSFFRECISLEMIHCLLASSNCPARKWRVCENFRIWGSMFLSEAAVRCNVYCIQMLFDIANIFVMLAVLRLFQYLWCEILFSIRVLETWTFY